MANNYCWSRVCTKLCKLVVGGREVIELVSGVIGCTGHNGQPMQSSENLLD